ncbi:MAG: ComEA family DNA-binding protein [Dissulfurimicrobium sp.]
MGLSHILFLILAIGLIILTRQLFSSYSPNDLYLKRLSLDQNTAYAHLFFRPIDINFASLEELTVLPGIGEKRAERILAFRASIGFFFSKDELYSPDGPISPRLTRSIIPYIKTDD